MQQSTVPAPFKYRNIAFVIVLSLITFGIYYLYWLISTQRELKQHGQEVPSVWWMFAPLLIIIAAILIALAGGIHGHAAGFAAATIVAIIIGGIGALILFIYPFFWFYKYCKAVETVTHERTSLLLGYGSWLALHIVGFAWLWPGIIQDGLNSLAEPSHTVPEPPYPKVTRSQH
jgi:cytochrome bd-type quinol oxidase subunit 2